MMYQFSFFLAYCHFSYSLCRRCFTKYFLSLVDHLSCVAFFSDCFPYCCHLVTLAFCCHLLLGFLFHNFVNFFTFFTVSGRTGSFHETLYRQILRFESLSYFFCLRSFSGTEVARCIKLFTFLML